MQKPEVGLPRESKKTGQYTMTHNSAKYWPIF